MDPLVEPALINGGWLVVVAALGFVFNRVTARAAIRATNANALAALDAAHQAQLWEKKAETYVDALAAIKRRTAARVHLTSPLRYDESTEERIRQTYADPADWDWAVLSARVSAFAPQSILDAVLAVTKADDEVRARVEDRKALMQQDDSPGNPAPSSDQLRAAWKAIPVAAEAAQAADNALETLIRDDLARKPSERAAIAAPQDSRS